MKYDEPEQVQADKQNLFDEDDDDEDGEFWKDKV